jgi:hypothetical protein
MKIRKCLAHDLRRRARTARQKRMSPIDLSNSLCWYANKQLHELSAVSVSCVAVAYDHE